MSTLLLCLRAVLLVVSFAGLSAAIAVRFRLDDCVAPFVAVSGIIVVLMLSGMLDVLFPAVCALYALGFAGAAYALFVKRARPRASTILALVAFVIFLIWRFYFCSLRRNDDLSHWGLVARHLLRHDRFPNGADKYVFFQSYPLGTACFIYYVGRITANVEGAYLVAQNFLLGMLFLPMFSTIRKRRNVLIPLCAALFFFLFHYYRYMIDLQVDMVLGFFGIGAAAAAVRYRNDFRRALLAVFPAMIALAYIKNSGLFFSILSAAMLAGLARKHEIRHRGALVAALFAAPVIAFLLWELHIKLRFPDALDTKHAVSIAAYARQTASKGLRNIAIIALRQFRALFALRGEKILALVALLPSSLLLAFAARELPAPRRRKVMRSFGVAVAVYFVWYLLIFFMYVFSMPESEALSLASLSRYSATGLAYLMGLTFLLLFLVLQETDPLPRLLRWGSRLCPIYIAAMIALTAWPGGARLGKMFNRDTKLPAKRAALQRLREEYGLEDGSRLLGFWAISSEDDDPPNFFYYMAKYEFETDDIIMIACDTNYPDQYFAGGDRSQLPEVEPGDTPVMISNLTELQNATHGNHVWVPLEDVGNFVSDKLPGSDAFLILADSEDFEARIAPALAENGENVPVCRLHFSTGV